MLKKILIGIAVTLMLLAGILAYMRSATKKHSPSAIAEYNMNAVKIEVKYCRPFKKNRIIFGDKITGALQPYGEYWRVGANEATIFNTNTDLKIGNNSLPKGQYALYAIPEKDTWIIAFNTEYERWGATPPDTNNDVLRVEVPSIEQNYIQEQFIITFEPNDSLINLVLNWDNVKIKLPLEPLPKAEK
ncbi:MAG: DUF2911 domain-containing protein [Bacteroidia bacterium]|nr:DUF2911 domain-containing protein [Bacteroidia bacterium]